MKLKKKWWLAIGCVALAVTAAAMVTGIVLVYQILSNVPLSWTGYQTSISNRILFQSEVGEWCVTNTSNEVLLPGLRGGDGRFLTQVAEVPAGLIFVVIDPDTAGSGSRSYAFLDRNSGSGIEFDSLDKIAETVPEVSSGLEFMFVSDYIAKHKLKRVW